jgi:hypothetical protein
VDSHRHFAMSLPQKILKSINHSNRVTQDAVHTAILTLKEGFEGQMTEDNIEIGICNDAGFRYRTVPLVPPQQ